MIGKNLKFKHIVKTHKQVNIQWIDLLNRINNEILI